MRRGIATIIDVIAITIVVLALLIWLRAVTVRTREEAYSLKCASNLKQIGTALLNYSTTAGPWPRTRYEPDTHPPTAFTAPDAQNPFADDGPQANDVTAAYYLLVRAGLDPNVFVCPLSLTNPTIPPSPQGLSNFKESNLSYSFANPYPTTQAVKLGMKYDARSITAEFAVAADMNPGGEKLLSTPPPTNYMGTPVFVSPNHRRIVPLMNALFGDYHVEPIQNPFFGPLRDNIFTFGGPMKDRGGLGIVGSPVNGNDSVLLPVASAAYWQPYIEAGRRDLALRWTIRIAAVALLAAFMLLIRFLWLRWRRTSALAGRSS